MDTNHGEWASLSHFFEIACPDGNPLGNVEMCLKQWSAVTKQWAGLEAIFLGSADIRRQLPEDKRFEGIDQEFGIYRKQRLWKQMSAGV